MNHDPAEIAVAMRRLRRALLARMRADDRRETRAATKRKASGQLASYDTAGLAKLLRPALEWDGRGWAVIAAEIGVTSPDLSRIMAGQDISAGKVFAICDWLKIDARKFYRPLKGRRKCFTGKAALAASRRASAALPPAAEPGPVPDRGAGRATRAGRSAGMFHGKSTETEGAE